MAKLKIVKIGDDTLKKVCRPIEKITPRILTLLDDMVETMSDANGCGLAGPQVGVLRRIVVIETEPGEVIELINPEIIKTEGERECVEGCLSVPGQYGLTIRPEKVTVQAYNRHGELVTYEGEDLLAQAFCHEIDHLDGILYTDIAERMLSRDELEFDE